MKILILLGRSVAESFSEWAQGFRCQYSMKRAAVAVVLLCLFGLPTPGISEDEQLPPEWTFDDKDEIKNWTGLHHLAPLELDEVRDEDGDKRSILRTLSIDVDPYVYLDGNANGFLDIEPFDGAKFGIVYIGLRVGRLPGS